MGSHRSREAMQRLQPWFLERAVAHGIELATPRGVSPDQRLRRLRLLPLPQRRPGRTAYEGLFLKRISSRRVYAALVSNQPMGFYPVEVLIWDGRRHGVRFRPVEINRSSARCSLEPGLGGPRVPSFASASSRSAGSGRRSRRASSPSGRRVSTRLSRTSAIGRVSSENRPRGEPLPVRSTPMG